MENTQKTPEQWFQMLKEPYRSEAIANINTEYTYYEETTKSLKDAIQFSFDWADSRQRHTYWSKIYNSIRKGETTYLETEKHEPEQIELRPEEPTDWKAKYNELKSNYELAKNEIEIEKDLREQWHNHYFKLKEEYNELKAKFDQLEPKGEKVYFYFNEKKGHITYTKNLEVAVNLSPQDSEIYEGVKIGVKKSVLVNEST